MKKLRNSFATTKNKWYWNRCKDDWFAQHRRRLNNE